MEISWYEVEKNKKKNHTFGGTDIDKVGRLDVCCKYAPWQDDGTDGDSATHGQHL